MTSIRGTCLLNTLDNPSRAFSIEMPLGVEVRVTRLIGTTTMSGESPLSVESQHLMIPTSEVLRFLHEKGYNTAGEGLSTFFDEEDSPEVDLDVTR